MEDPQELQKKEMTTALRLELFPYKYSSHLTRASCNSAKLSKAFLHKAQEQFDARKHMSMINALNIVCREDIF